MLMITNPAKFDVIVTENLSEIFYLMNQVPLARLESCHPASHSEKGQVFAEPIHGSAHMYVTGQRFANPISMILSSP